jgi:hypothetical protein
MLKRIALTILAVGTIIVSGSAQFPILQGVLDPPGSSFPAAPVPGMQLWVSADCTILTGSTCSTFANGTKFNSSGNPNTWADRSSNAAPMAMSGGNSNCTLNTNQINGLPAVNMTTPTSCQFILGGPVDVGGTTTTWTEFIVLKNNATGYTGFITSGTGASSVNPDGFAFETSTTQNAAAAGFTGVGHGTASQDTSWHVMSVQYTIGTGLAFTIDGATDTTIGFSSQPVAKPTTIFGSTTNSLGATLDPINSKVAEFLIYSSATTPLSSTNITTNLKYLRHKYGQI